METYFLNGVDIKSYGQMPGQHNPESDLAISGAWDMPPRMGKCFHDWGDQDGVEPYVLEEEIRIGGRDILFTGLLEASDRYEALTKLYNFYKVVGSFNTTVPLHSPEYGTWNVLISGEITVDYIGGGWCTFKIPFHEPAPDMSGTMPTNKPLFTPVNVGGVLLNGAGNVIQVGSINYDGYGIDGISFNDLGLIILDMSGHWNRPAPKAGEAIGYSTEPYQITKTNAREITLRALISQPNYAAFKEVLKGLYVLFKKPGLRYMTRKKDALRDFFVMKGFTVTNVHTYGEEVDGILEVTLTEVGAHTEWDILATSIGQFVQSDFGNIITT